MSTLSKIFAIIVIILIIVVIGLNLYLNRELEPEVRDCITFTDYTREECELSQGITSEI